MGICPCVLMLVSLSGSGSGSAPSSHQENASCQCLRWALQGMGGWPHWPSCPGLLQWPFSAKCRGTGTTGCPIILPAPPNQTHPPSFRG